MLKVLSSSPGTAKKKERSQGPVSHACNPGYSGGRDQEDQVLKPAQANRSGDHILKNHHKKGLVERLKM
jgi:hypothetical protein